MEFTKALTEHLRERSQQERSHREAYNQKNTDAFNDATASHEENWEEAGFLKRLQMRIKEPGRGSWRDYAERFPKANLLERLQMRFGKRLTDLALYYPEASELEPDRAYEQWEKILNGQEEELIANLDRTFYNLEQNILALEQALKDFPKKEEEEPKKIFMNRLARHGTLLGKIYDDDDEWNAKSGNAGELILSLRCAGGALFNLLESVTTEEPVHISYTFFDAPLNVPERFIAGNFKLEEEIGVTLRKIESSTDSWRNYRDFPSDRFSKALKTKELAKELQDFYRNRYGKKIQKLLDETKKQCQDIRSRKDKETQRLQRLQGSF